MLQALERIRELEERSERVGVDGTPRIQRRLAHGASICEICSPSRRWSRGRRWNERKAAARNSGTTIPPRTKSTATFNIVVRKGATGGEMQLHARAHPADAGRAEADHSGDEVMATATFRIWRGEKGQGQFQRLHQRNLGRHGGARRRAPNPGGAGGRSGRALELQGGQMRLVLGGNQRHAQADVHDAPEYASAGSAGNDRADEGFSAHEGPGDGCFVELSE